ncbi:interferon gamma receptor 1 isoform X2 [Hyla sarda]|uniref:interferon gamma receptor 1 isoform X2 n=1 Tax=Hyla sarda TaxID=327740 RepID=UPI0024C32892|nr:interferon gamma receptor 1 isoform X2 [Hyla sarda]
MEAIRHTTLPFLLLSALVAGTGPTPTSSPGRVQRPFNLKKESYNFNSTLSWDYNKSFITPYFHVEYKHKGNPWTVLETCRNISSNYCDLSKIIIDPYDYYTVQVKASVGSEVSEYAQTEFYLINDGIIGPPGLNASVEGKFLIVDVWYPRVPPITGEINVGDYLEDLTYDIHYGNETKETDECDRFGCSASILISNQNTYCFSAQGKSIDPMTIEKSKEICIDIIPPANGISNRFLAIILPIVIVGIILLALCFFIIKRKLESTSLLPLSLNTMAKAVTAHLPSDQVTKYDKVSVSSPDSPGDKMTPEEADKDLNGADDSDIRVSIDQGYQSSAGEAEQKAQDDQNGIEESSNSSTNNYYHTENGDSSFVCIKENGITEQEPVQDIKPITNSFGYDKPHCPL